MWRHIENVLICMNFEKVFSKIDKSQVNNENQNIFDFNKFYEDKNNSPP